MSGTGARHAVVRYVAHPNAGTHWCVYCGMPAEVRDHFFPKSAVNTWSGIVVSRHVRRLCFTVPACAECNLMLGARVALTFEGRREHLREKLRRKYAKRLAAPRWTEEELATKSGLLQTHIRARQFERDIILTRIAYEHDQEIGPLPERVEVVVEARKAA